MTYTSGCKPLGQRKLDILISRILINFTIAIVIQTVVMFLELPKENLNCSNALVLFFLVRQQSDIQQSSKVKWIVFKSEPISYYFIALHQAWEGRTTYCLRHS